MRLQYSALGIFQSLCFDHPVTFLPDCMPVCLHPRVSSHFPELICPIYLPCPSFLHLEPTNQSQISCCRPKLPPESFLRLHLNHYFRCWSLFCLGALVMRHRNFTFDQFQTRQSFGYIGVVLPFHRSAVLELCVRPLCATLRHTPQAGLDCRIIKRKKGLVSPIPSKHVVDHDLACACLYLRECHSLHFNRAFSAE